MSTDSRVKYYEGFLVDSEREVPAEKAQKARRYSKAFYGSAERLEKVEQYEEGKLRRVDYFDVTQDNTLKTEHAQRHGQVPFVTHRQLSRTKGFVWKAVHVFTATGELSEVTTILQDEARCEWMELSADASRKVSRIAKYYWESPEDLKYSFEYDGEGKLLEVQDVENGERASLDEVRASVPDVSFFEEGLRLPKPLAGTSIPT
ncbi:hypothetical protein [Myxococcus sp. RHSTA-1-4]|uniref:hypothetical protein n=1 Tax=Myxococcus sp. RHSTA-1-4 TaxID=2874601 RepID=UPI001CC00A9F|nr:hypothetical protein [Myxococcus sp. RHSTA-1-4]MBZ4418526.1 hypothetical protein [Myxococcus sp. RHSTA-1-4]